MYYPHEYLNFLKKSKKKICNMLLSRKVNLDLKILQNDIYERFREEFV